MDISEEDFMEEYEPVEAGGEGDFMFETLDSALNAAEPLAAISEVDDPIEHVWTVVEDDETDALYAAAGRHIVNALGFLATHKAWKTGIEQAVWFEAEEPDQGASPGL